MQNTGISATELRVEITRHWRQPLYILAARIRVHPASLSNMLRERVAMPAAVKLRILGVLAEHRHGR
ncbi:MAG: hypothetical protein OJF51_000120 [Nitrospira sp.]|jgi:hypothetical protein|nr:MAG: hypothetical protein OJF51_000120 [Nitrospira sp.]